MTPSPHRGGRAAAVAVALALALALAAFACPATAAEVAAPAADAAPSAAAPPDAAAPAQVLVMLRTPVAHARVDGGYGASGYGDAVRAQVTARIGTRLAGELGLQVATAWPLPALGMDCIVLTLPPGRDIGPVIDALQAHAEVAWAQPMNEFHAQGQAAPGAMPGAAHGHADPLYPLQPAARQWHLDDLHAVATGRRVRVAVVDSGVDTAHPDLAGAVAAQANFVDGQAYVAELHGTAVAGLVAAQADNGVGIVGIAPDARLLALRACWEAAARRTLCNSLSLAKALEYAIDHRADIINLSLSGPPDLLLGRLIDVALARRQRVVAAVDAEVADGGFPAAHPGVIAVADDARPVPAHDVGAPAHDLPATVPGGGWQLVQGSSFAAGQVSGLLALLDEAGAGGDGPLLRVAARPAAGAPLVRLPDGAIDACGSVGRAGGAAVLARLATSPGCAARVARQSTLVDPDPARPGRAAD